MLVVSSVFIYSITSSKVSSWSCFPVPWLAFIYLVARLMELRYTTQITITVTRRTEKVTAKIIKPSCQFSSLFSFATSLISKSSFLTGSLWKVVIVKENMPNCSMSTLCDAGVAVTLTCVTVPGEASCWELRISWQDVVCFVSRETEDGWTLPVIEDWLESTWEKLQNRKLNGCFQTFLDNSWENRCQNGNILTCMRCDKPSVSNGRLNFSSLNKGIPLISSLGLNKLYIGELLTPSEMNLNAKRYIAGLGLILVHQPIKFAIETDFKRCSQPRSN